MVDLFLVVPQLGVLLLQFFQLLVQLHPLGGGRRRHAAFQVGDGGAVAALLLVDIVGADAGDGVRLIAVQIDERLEAVFLAAVKKPIDGPLLVGLAVVGVEVVQEIAADHIPGRAFSAQSVGDEFEVFLQGVAAVDRLDKFDKPAYNVIVKVFVVADGDDVVRCV